MDTTDRRSILAAILALMLGGTLSASAEAEPEPELEPLPDCAFFVTLTDYTNGGNYRLVTVTTHGPRATLDYVVREKVGNRRNERVIERPCDPAVVRTVLSLFADLEA